MKSFSQGAVLTAGAALVLMVSLALSNVGAVSGATQFHPDMIKQHCDSKSACMLGSNAGGGAGVEGVASSVGAALFGYSSYASAPSDWHNGALYGVASGVNGVYGYSAKRAGAVFENNDDYYYSLYVLADSPGGYPLRAYNSANDTFFDVDYGGNGTFSGDVTASQFNTDVRTHDGGDVAAFGAESTRATLEDTGTARLTGGLGAVRFDQSLRRVIDTRSGYQVFLTPGGDTRGLYTFAKYQDGFIVREIEHGRSSIDFDYRVVFHPHGASQERLPELQLRRPNKDGRIP
jgi:hypothetical protein